MNWSQRYNCLKHNDSDFVLFSVSSIRYYHGYEMYTDDEQTGNKEECLNPVMFVQLYIQKRVYRRFV